MVKGEDSCENEGRRGGGSGLRWHASRGTYGCSCRQVSCGDGGGDGFGWLVCEIKEGMDDERDLVECRRWLAGRMGELSSKLGLD